MDKDGERGIKVNHDTETCLISKPFAHVNDLLSKKESCWLRRKTNSEKVCELYSFIHLTKSFMEQVAKPFWQRWWSQFSSLKFSSELMTCPSARWQRGKQIIFPVLFLSSFMFLICHQLSIRYLLNTVPWQCCCMLCRDYHSIFLTFSSVSMLTSLQTMSVLLLERNCSVFPLLLDILFAYGTKHVLFFEEWSVFITCITASFTGLTPPYSDYKSISCLFFSFGSLFLVN